MEGYLDTMLNRTHIIWYTKIRISNHMFAVGTGMKDCVYFVKKQTNLVIEDEKHALSCFIGMSRLQKNYIIA